MPAFIDLTGKKYNLLTVLKRSENAKNGEARWQCLCDCGNITYVTASNLKSGLVQSCGCLLGGHKTHGGTHTRLYKIWKGMRARCNNKNLPQYNDYGGRGITICDEWNDFLIFKEWAENNGYTDSLTIDRIDNNGNYCPENCRWTTRKKQNNNKRNNLYITFNEKKHSLTEWCDILNLPTKIIYERIVKCHQSFEQAISAPLPNN